MRILLCIFILEIIFIFILLIKYYKLKKVKADKLYCHEKKSMMDTFKMCSIWLFWYVLVILFNFIIESVIKNTYLVTTFNIVSFLIVVPVCALAVYLITEIKHISSDDGIWKKIQSINNNNICNNAKKYYKSEFYIGLFLDITLLIHLFFVDKVYGIAYILMNLFFYYFGMADVLQHDGYNSSEYKNKLKKMKLRDKCLVSNLYRYIFDSDYHNKKRNVLKENTINIIKGIKNIL